MWEKIKSFLWGGLFIGLATGGSFCTYAQHDAGGSSWGAGDWAWRLGGVVVLLLLAGLFFWLAFGGGEPDEADWKTGGVELKGLIAEAIDDKFDAFERLYATVGAGQWSDRFFLLEGVVSHYDDGVIQGWVGQSQSTAPHCLMFMRKKGKGLTARDEGDAARAQQLLDAAEQHLHHACQLDPTDPTPYVFLIFSAKYRAEPRQVADRWLGEALRRDPDCSAAVHAMMYYLFEHGDYPHELIAFARSVAQNRPAGTPLHASVLIAYRWAWAGTDNEQQRAWVMSDPAVRAEILAAYDASLGAAGWRSTRATVDEHNCAAWLLYKLGDTQRLAREVAAIGDRVIDPYWTDFDSVPEYFTAAKAAIGHA